MKRRQALATLSIASGSLILPTGLFLGCQTDAYQPKFFAKKDVALLNEIGETILPETETSPGAKSQKVGNFIDAYVADCYTLPHQKIVQDGLNELQKNTFLKLIGQERHNLLIQMDAEAIESETTHYFSIIKQLILFAYFTSKGGATQALRYVPVPGKYEGNYPYQEGDKAWAL